MNQNNEILIPSIALVCLLSFGIYRLYLRNRQFTGKGAKIFPLYNPKYKRVAFIIYSLPLIFYIFYGAFLNYSAFGLICILGVIPYSIASIFVFPNHHGHFIMTDINGIFAYEIGKVEWCKIKRYKFNYDSMVIEIELNDSTKILAAAFNKNIDTDSLEDEIKKNIS